MSKSLADCLAERGMTLAALVDASGVEMRVVKAIAEGRFTPSPEQRKSLATVFGISPDDIAWGHVAQISHVYGHGPQFGRSP